MIGDWAGEHADALVLLTIYIFFLFFLFPFLFDKSYVNFVCLLFCIFDHQVIPPFYTSITPSYTIVIINRWYSTVLLVSRRPVG